MLSILKGSHLPLINKWCGKLGNKPEVGKPTEAAICLKIQKLQSNINKYLESSIFTTAIYCILLSKMVKGHHGNQRKMEPNGHHLAPMEEIPTTGLTEIMSLDGRLDAGTCQLTFG